MTTTSSVARRAAVLVFGALAAFVLHAAAAQPASRAAIERAKAAVVAVGTFQRTRTPQFRFTGTGFAVADGTLIATNAHVIPAVVGGGAEPETLAALLPGVSADPARIVEVERVSTDAQHDLALLRLKAVKLVAMPLRENDNASEGDTLLFTGFPIGAVLGPFAATHRAMIAAITPIALPPPSAGKLDANVVRQLQRGAFTVYQLDGTAYPGNSGSPLYDAASGEVIGVVNMVFVKGLKENALTNPSGITYAIPVRHLRALLAAPR